MNGNVIGNAESKHAWTVNIWPTIGISIIGGVAVIVVVALVMGWAITRYVIAPADRKPESGGLDIRDNPINE